MTAPEGPDPLALAHPTRVAVVGAGAVGHHVRLRAAAVGAGGGDRPRRRQRAQGRGRGDGPHARGAVRPHGPRVGRADRRTARAPPVTVIAAGAAQKPGETRLDLVAQERGDLPRDRPAGRRGEPGRDHPRRDQPGRRPGLPGLPDLGPARRSASSDQRHDPRHGRFRMLLAEHYGVDPRSVHAYIVGRARRLRGAGLVDRPTSPGCRSRDFAAATTGSGTTPRRSTRSTSDDPRRRLPDHRAQGRDVLRRRGRAGADRRGDPARPAHGAVGELADPRLLRHRRRLPQPAHGHRTATGSSGSCRWGCPPRRRPGSAGPRSCCARRSATSGSTSLPDGVAGRNRRSCPRMGS